MKDSSPWRKRAHAKLSWQAEHSRKILFDCFRIRSYTLIDLPEVLEFARRFLEVADPAALQQVRFSTLNDLDSSARWQLVVSNCALSECVPHVQQKYIE